jgi:hypothetical protein
MIEAVQAVRLTAAGALVSAGALFGLAAAVGGAGVARADFHSDVQFLSLLDQHGIQVQNTSWAHGICADLDAGSSPFEEVNKVYYGSPLNRDQSMWFTSAAIVVYCPWHSTAAGQQYFDHRPLGVPPAPLETVAPNPVQTVTFAERGGHR